jgi:hypothetical protein
VILDWKIEERFLGRVMSLLDENTDAEIADDLRLPSAAPEEAAVKGLDSLRGGRVRCDCHSDDDPGVTKNVALAPSCPSASFKPALSSRDSDKIPSDSWTCSSSIITVDILEFSAYFDGDSANERVELSPSFTSEGAFARRLSPGTVIIVYGVRA